jgi:hypothetical protein
MNYQKIYNNIVSRGKERVLEGYQEKHHIIPRCMGGSDEDANLVMLTPEEHYLCHLLLVKIHPNNMRLVKAAMFMVASTVTQQRNNKLYGWLKRQYSDYMKGPNNPSKLNGVWNKGKLGYKNKVNFSNESLKLFSDRMKKNNPCAGIKPWNHPRATTYTKSIWVKADEIYTIWLSENKPSYCRLHTLVNGKMYDNVSIGPFMNMVKYFRNGWVPTKDNEWDKFKNVKTTIQPKH